MMIMLQTDARPSSSSFYFIMVTDSSTYICISLSSFTILKPQALNGVEQSKTEQNQLLSCWPRELPNECLVVLQVFIQNNDNCRFAFNKKKFLILQKNLLTTTIQFSLVLFICLFIDVIIIIIFIFITSERNINVTRDFERKDQVFSSTTNII